MHIWNLRVNKKKKKWGKPLVNGFGKEKWGEFAIGERSTCR
jgi:hypothetical protein